ncbi:MAG TPA: site-2 protease family protein [Gammaproteobacteria bacterium]|nr:site-2 protease family protein [Gammaproteobacteria bacterium]
MNQTQTSREGSTLNTGFRVGSIAGIHIFVDWSLLIIFFLVTSSLGAGVFPEWHPDWGGGLIWITALTAAILFFVSVLLHELSHALVGRAQGIDIRRITLFVFGGVAQLEREPHRWQAELLMAIVGPITSFVLGLLFIFLGSASAGEEIQPNPSDPLQTFSALGPLATVLLWIGPINILLGAFNLVPGFPLDGGRALRAVLWGLTGDLYRATRWAAGLGQGVAWILIGCGFAMIFGTRVPVFGTGVVGGMWIALIGWFLNNAAIMSYRQLLVQRSMEHVPVSRIMLSQFDTVAPDMPISTLIEDYIMRSDQRAFPVVENGRLVGLVCLEDVRRVDPTQRATLAVRAIMTPAHALTTVAPEEASTEALQALSRREVNQLPVVKHGTVRGLIRREDILKWLSLHGEQAVAR